MEWGEDRKIGSGKIEKIEKMGRWTMEDGKTGNRKSGRREDRKWERERKKGERKNGESEKSKNGGKEERKRILLSGKGVGKVDI
jgi:hypothetical protein